MSTLRSQTIKKIADGKLPDDVTNDIIMQAKWDFIVELYSHTNEFYYYSTQQMKSLGNETLGRHQDFMAENEYLFTDILTFSYLYGEWAVICRNKEQSFDRKIKESDNINEQISEQTGESHTGIWPGDSCPDKSVIYDLLVWASEKDLTNISEYLTKDVFEQILHIAHCSNNINTINILINYEFYDHSGCCEILFMLIINGYKSQAELFYHKNKQYITEEKINKKESHGVMFEYMYEASEYINSDTKIHYKINVIAEFILKL
jgi:hypothetical protein